MPWHMLWPDFLKKRLCRYLLQHYLGHFFKEKISLEQLSIDIYNGTGYVKNLNLDCEALNEQISAASSLQGAKASSPIPIEIVSGFVGYISVSIPWHNLLNDYCKLSIKNVQVTIRTKQKKNAFSRSNRDCMDNSMTEDSEETFYDGEDAESSASNSMFSSMFVDSLMNTSIHIAQECLNDEKLDDPGPVDPIKSETKQNSLLGLEAFASTIDSILSRIKINIENIQIRIENLDSLSFKMTESNVFTSSTLFNNRPSNGIALELRIKSIKYFDLDSVSLNQTNPSGASNASSPDTVNQNNINMRNTTKSFNIEGLTIYFDEFIVRDEADLSENKSDDEDNEKSLNSTIDIGSDDESKLSLQPQIQVFY